MIKITDIKLGLCFLGYTDGLFHKFNILKYFLFTIPTRVGLKYHYDKDIVCKIKDIEFIFKSSSCELYSSKDIFIDRNYEKLPEFEVKNQNIIFDIGANIGLYSLWAAKNNPNSKIFSFEPNPDTYKRLYGNITLNKINNVFPYELAVTSKNGISVFKKCKDTWLSMIADIEDSDTVNVKSITLDKFVSDKSIDIIDLLKIDVEGSELDVLNGSINSLKYIRRVIFEYHSKELYKNCLNILNEYGYEIVYTQHTIYNTGLVYCVNKRLGAS